MTPTHANFNQAAHLVIPTSNGHKKLSSLRPGDWLRNDRFELDVCVMINSPKLQRIVIYYPGAREEESRSYEEMGRTPEYKGIASGWQFVGAGRRRKWLRFLPKFVARHFCEYSRPN